ncbi:MAG: PaREP1 family protein [Nitrososphaerales archaeon]
MTSETRQTEYERLNDKYLREAEELLTRKDYAQASEKIWGATAEMVKAVAAKRGLNLGTHRRIGEFVDRLHKEHPEWRLREAFAYANSLHTNFYEDWLTEDFVLEAAEKVKQFTHKLRSLL